MGTALLFLVVVCLLGMEETRRYGLAILGLLVFSLVVMLAEPATR